MRTLRAGWDVARIEPQALVPFMLEALAAGALVVVGVLPTDPATVISTGAFPIGIYHDVKQLLAFAPGWTFFGAVLAVGILVRTATVTATLWLADDERGGFLAAYARALLLGLIAAALLLIPATLHFVGSAIRYAPFVLVGGAIGVIVAARLARSAVNLNMGSGRLTAKHAPGLGAYLTYSYLFPFLAALVLLAGDAKWPVAALIASMGPIHAVVLLGWRELAADDEDVGGGVVLIVSAIAAAALILAGVYDRHGSDPEPTRIAVSDGTLLLLGGVDSTSETGALARFDPRTVGVSPKITRLLSYRGVGEPYEAQDTRRDLEEIAQAVASQVERSDPQIYLLGHSQSALIVDRVFKQGATEVEAEASISGSPAVPPFWPRPLSLERGSPALDASDAFVWVLDRLNASTYDLTAPASPIYLRPVTPCTPSCPVPRLNVWPILDSVWLDTDWRRPGEVNVVAISDHVGAVDDVRSLGAIRDFFAAKHVDDDQDGTWRVALVSVVRAAFDPWRPGR